MADKKKYTTSSGMRMALEERLNKISVDEGVDIVRLRRYVSFDRFLARIFHKAPNDMVVKGGYALELRLDYARTTKDVDISFKSDLDGFWANDKERLQEFLQECVSVDLGDFFEFIIGRASLDLENAPYGGFRFPVEVRMDGRVFSKFSIDMSTGDTWIDPHDIVCPPDWLGFAGIESPRIKVISIEQQLSEKLHAYTLPRNRPNSRVKDIVDIIVLIRKGQLNITKLQVALRETFRRRKTHKFPKVLPNVSEDWNAPFNKMVRECNINVSLDKAIEEIQKFCVNHELTNE